MNIYSNYPHRFTRKNNNILVRKFSISLFLISIFIVAMIAYPIMLVPSDMVQAEVNTVNKVDEIQDNQISNNIKDQSIGQSIDQSIDQSTPDPTPEIQSNENSPSRDIDNTAGSKETNQPQTPSTYDDNRDYRVDDRGSIEVISQTNEKKLDSSYSIYRLNQDQSEELIFQSSTEYTPVVKLDNGIYRVEVTETEKISSDPIILRNGMTKQFVAKFTELELSPYSFNNKDTVEVEIINDLDQTVWIGSLIRDENQVLYVAETEYKLKSPYSDKIVKTINTGSDVSVPILIDQIAIEPFAVVTFGDLVVNITTTNGNPLYGVSITLYNATNNATMTSGTTDNNGMFTSTLAPGAYNIKTYKTFNTIYTQIWNSSVIIVGEQQTLLNLTFSQVVIYEPSSVPAYLYDNTTGAYIGYQYTSAGTKQTTFYFPAGRSYDITINSKTYYVTTEMGMKHVFGTKINNIPYFYRVTTTGRITANENTNITIIAIDNDYDYPLSFNFAVNIGTIIIGTPGWVAYNQWGVTVQYLAPSTNNVYQFNMSISDGTNSSNTRIYLSSRTSLVTFNSTGYNDRPLSSIIYIYNAIDYVYVSYLYTNTATGIATFNMPDGEYYFNWVEDNRYRSTSQLYNATVGNYYVSHSWAEVRLITRAEFGNPISITVKVYNGTYSQTTQITSKGTDASGFASLILTPYTNYSFYAYASTGIWNVSNSFIGGSNYNISFNFGAIVLYAFDVGNPLYIGVNYYLNDSNAIYYSYAYTSSAGIVVFRLSPGNYAFQVLKSVNEWFYNVNITNNEAKVIGDFVNSNPVISSISASPARINAGENTTITVVMSDNDVVDTHTYTWTSNVGSFIGTGPSVMFIAPAILGLYKIEVLIQDNFGGNTSSYIYVSNRGANIIINSTYENGTPKQALVYMNAILNYGYSYITYFYTSATTGLATYSALDGEYLVNGVLDNSYQFEIFVNGSDVRVNMTWSGILVNVKTYNNQSYATGVKLYNPDFSSQISSKSSTNGQTTFYVTPGNYSLRSDSSNTFLYKYNITSLPNQVVTYEFAYGQIEINALYADNNPANLVAYLYQGIINVYLSYGYLSNTGQYTYNVAPGNYSLQITSTPTNYIYNLIVTPYGKVISNTTTGVLAIYTNNGTNLFNYYTRINWAGTGSQITSGNTGTDGMIIYQLLPGMYDVLVDTTWYYNVTIIEGARTILGNKTNSNPSIEAVSSSIGKLSGSQTAEITVQVSDVDYDYANLYAVITLNTGGLSGVNVFRQFVSFNNFQFKFNYSSPALLQTMMLNISIFDESGGFDNFVFIISNQMNTVNIHSLRGDNLSEETSVLIYDHQTGVSIRSAYTYNGLAVLNNLPDGWYDFVFYEFTNIRIDSLWIIGGQTFNVTANFGQLMVTSVGVGGAPLSSVVYVYNGTSNAYIGYRYTLSSTGMASFILAPGYYKIVVVESTNIEFFVLIEGGGIAIVGAGIPNLVQSPGDLTFSEGSTGNILTWTFSDTNPSTYNVTVNGTQYTSGIWTGNPIDINVDNLPQGTYLVRIYVNDTYGLVNSDSVIVKVLRPSTGTLTSPPDQTITDLDNVVIDWSITSTLSGTYSIYRNGVNISSGNWANDSSMSIFEGPFPVGSYNYTILIVDFYGATLVDEVIITVTIPPQATLSNPIDESIYDQESASINWDISSTISGTYTVYRDGVILQSGNWTNTTGISITDGPLSVGSYNYTIVIEDSYGRSISDEVIITVATPPVFVLTSPVDQSIYDQESASITWDISSTISGTYMVYRDGVILQSGSWTNTTSISITDGPLSVGSYNYTIVIEDSYGRSISDEVIITVATPPVFDLTSPVDRSLTVGSNTTITWSIFSAISGNYVIYENGVSILSGNWAGDEDITINVYPSNSGSYNYTIVVNDSYGRSASDTVIINVSLPETASVSNPATLSINDGENATISWIVSGTISGTYIIYKDGSILENGVWANNMEISLDNGPLTTGSYNYTLYLVDSFSREQSYTVIVTVTPSSVVEFTSKPNDLILGLNSSITSIEWEITGVSSATYEIKVDGISEITGMWSGSGSIAMDISSMSEGTYKITIVITASGNSISDDVYLTIVVENTSSNTSESPGFGFLSIILVLGIGVHIYSKKRRIGRKEL